MYGSRGIAQWLLTKEDPGHSYIIVKSIKEFAISDPPPGDTGRY